MAADHPIPKDIRDVASRWVTARDAGTLTDGDERALAEWLAADPRNAQAFAQVEAFWGGLGSSQIKAALADRYDGSAAARPARRATGIARRWAAPALAASLALILIGAANDWPTRLQADAMTATGERRTVPLADGSLVQLNTDSAIAIDYRDNRRVIRLLKGEAAFTVAPDRARPFTVEAGGGSATALGTRFLVRRDGEDTDVTVTEHRVLVASPPDGRRIVTEGETTRYGPEGIASPHGVDAVASEAWTRGTLVFVDRPLGEVVAELNRYHPGFIRVIGNDLWHRRVSGGFRTDDPLAAIDTLQHSLGIRSAHVTDRLIFLYS